MAPQLVVHEALRGGTQEWYGRANNPVLATAPTSCLAEPVRPTTRREQAPKPLPAPYASGKWQVWTGPDGWQHWSYQAEPSWDTSRTETEDSAGAPSRSRGVTWADQVGANSHATGSRDEWMGREQTVLQTRERHPQPWGTPTASGGKGERARSASPTAPMVVAKR
eukprot:4979985-Amphidinium_carterae.1